MEFDRQRRIAGLWNWLPVFRAAAEYESLQRAALAFSLSPSAVSRTIKLLEGAVGFALFERLPTGVRLTAKGDALLRATRDAMRRVDDALEPLLPEQRIGAVGPYLPALVARAGAAHVTSLSMVEANDVAGALLRGEVDLVFAHQWEEGPDMACQAVGEMQLFVARGRHPGLIAPHFLVPEADGETVHRVDELSAMLATAAASNRSVLLPRSLAPSGSTLEPHSARLPVCVIARRPTSGEPKTAPFCSALAELL